MTGSVISPDCVDKDVIAWTVTWPDGRGTRGRIPNHGPEWWQLAVARMKQGATVVEIRMPRLAVDVSPVLDHRFIPDGMDPGICQRCGSTKASHRDASPRPGEPK